MHKETSTITQNQVIEKLVLDMDTVNPKKAKTVKSYFNILPPIIAGLISVIVNYGGTFILIFQAAQIAGLSPELTASWVWSISIILDNFWIDDDCYGIELTKSQIVEYAFFALCEVQNDEIISHLKQKLIDDKKHEKLLLKDYDFYILAGILSMIGNIHTIIRRVLTNTADQLVRQKLFENYKYWLGFTNEILGKNSADLVGKLEEHPDMYGDLWYSFHEVWTGMRFWLKDYNIDSTRVLKLANDGWQREKYYSKLQEKVDEDNMSMSLFTYLIVCYCFGCEDNKKKALEDMRSMSSEIVKAVAKNIEDELKSFGSASAEYKKILEDLEGSIDGK